MEAPRPGPDAGLFSTGVQTMTKTAQTVAEEKQDKMSIKAQKERDAEDAMRAYRQEQAAVRDRMAELRAMRLAREAQAAATPATVVPAVGKPTERAKKPKATRVRVARPRS